jgi:hypothetical protein
MVSAVSMTTVSVDVVEEAGECGLESTEPSMLGRSLEVESDSRTGSCEVESYVAPALSDLGGSAPDAAGPSGK